MKLTVILKDEIDILSHKLLKISKRLNQLNELIDSFNKFKDGSIISRYKKEFNQELEEFRKIKDLIKEKINEFKEVEKRENLEIDFTLRKLEKEIKNTEKLLKLIYGK